MTPPFPFRPPADVPIIGQACTPIACTHTVVVRCNCEAQSVFVIEGVSRVAMCPACRLGYKIGDLQYIASTGQGFVVVTCVGVIPGSPSATTQPPTQ